LKGTEAEAVRFHDDKSTYTGAHNYNEKHVGADASSALGRHDKMAAEKQQRMQAKEGEEDGWGEVERVFKAFAGANATLDGREFYNMCMNIGGLVHGCFVKEDVDSIFAAVCPRNQRNIQLNEFKDAVREIALKKDEATHVTQGCIGRSKGPTMHGTTDAEYVKFHDDKDQYTGTHVGKP